VGGVKSDDRSKQEKGIPTHHNPFIFSRKRGPLPRHQKKSENGKDVEEREGKGAQALFTGGKRDYFPLYDKKGRGSTAGPRVKSTQKTGPRGEKRLLVTGILLSTTTPPPPERKKKKEVWGRGRPGKERSSGLRGKKTLPFRLRKKTLPEKRETPTN